MADNGQPDPPDHAPIHGTDRPAFQQHSNTADGVAAAPPARENNNTIVTATRIESTAKIVGSNTADGVAAAPPARENNNTIVTAARTVESTAKIVGSNTADSVAAAPPARENNNNIVTAVSAKTDMVLIAIDKEFSIPANYPKGGGSEFKHWQ